MRDAEADARWPIMIIMPSIRNGGCSISTYELKATIVPTVVPPSDHHDPAEEQHQGQPEPRQVVHHRRPPAADPGVLQVGPADPVGRLGQGAQLAALGGERLDDPDALDVLVDHGGQLGQPGLDQPGHREDRLAHAHAEQADDRHGGHRDDGQRHVDREHQRRTRPPRSGTAPGSTGRRTGTSAPPGCRSWTGTSARRTGPGRRSRTASGPGGRRRCCAGRTRARTRCAAGRAGRSR